MTESQPTLPGLDDAMPATTAMEKAARMQIQQLRADGMLGPENAITVALVLDLARVVGISCQKGRAAGAALAARQLLDAMEKLPTGQTGLDKLMAELQALDA